MPFISPSLCHDLINVLVNAGRVSFFILFFGFSDVRLCLNTVWRETNAKQCVRKRVLGPKVYNITSLSGLA